jgi:HSP20 family protein
MLTLWRNPDTTFAALERLLDQAATPSAAWTGYGLTPAADVLETDDAFRVVLDMPGHDAKAIRIEVEKDTLTVQSERKFVEPGKDEVVHRSERAHGAFFRSLALPASVDAAKVEARYENGVLTVVLPKRDEAKPRKIQVNAK